MRNCIAYLWVRGIETLATCVENAKPCACVCIDSLHVGVSRVGVSQAEAIHACSICIYIYIYMNAIHGRKMTKL